MGLLMALLQSKYKTLAAARVGGATLVLAFAAVFSASTFAADLPQRALAPVYKAAPEPIDYFSGFFIGGEIGYGWGRGDTDATSQFGDISYTYKTDGVVGGLNAGYRWRTAPNGYVGIVTSIDATDLSDTQHPDPVGNIISTTGKQTWLGTTGLQLGFTPAPTTLLYASGGVAYGGVKSSTAFIAPIGNLSSSDTKVGWYLGAGFDVAFAPNWTWGAEYKYVDLGKVKVSWNTIAGPMSASSDITNNIVMLNVKYRFGH